jgi:transcriptional regulator with XRE-family HTH domain
VDISPTSGLRSIGATISAARSARGLTQQRLAKEARVSRAQLAALEQGQNVSVAFLLKVAHFLELRTIPLDGTVELSAGNGQGLHLFDAMEALDLLAAVGDYVRDVITAAALPLSARRELSDTPAFTEFLAKHLGSDQGLDRLTNAILRMSDDRISIAGPPSAAELPARRSARNRSRE